MTEQSIPEAKRGRRLLVVDDELGIVNTLETILRLDGYEVETAASGDEAVERAAQFRPDLVLSDVVMPGINCIEACIRIHAFLPACKIVLLSGNAVVHDLLRDARARGYEFDILLKPIHPLELLEHLHAAVDQY